LQQIGCPAGLVQIFLLTFRYNFVLAGEVESMGMAVASRGLRRGFNRPTFSALGWVVGSLLVRSKDRSLRLYDAMLARGYTGQVRTLHKHSVRGPDWMKMILFFALAGLLVGIQRWR
jgi:cobalt/nickel transport system permease protein